LENVRFVFLSPPFGVLGAIYDVHLRLIGNRVVDFLLGVIELFARWYTPLRRYERNRLKIGFFAPTRSAWPKISGTRGRPRQTILLLRKIG